MRIDAVRGERGLELPPLALQDRSVGERTWCYCAGAAERQVVRAGDMAGGEVVWFAYVE